MQPAARSARGGTKAAIAGLKALDLAAGTKADDLSPLARLAAAENRKPKIDRRHWTRRGRWPPSRGSEAAPPIDSMTRI